MFYLKILLLSVTYQQTGSLFFFVYIFVFVSTDASEFFIRNKVTQTAKRIRVLPQWHRLESYQG